LGYIKKGDINASAGAGERRTKCLLLKEKRQKNISIRKAYEKVGSSWGEGKYGGCASVPMHQTVRLKKAKWRKGEHFSYSGKARLLKT